MTMSAGIVAKKPLAAGLVARAQRLNLARWGWLSVPLAPFIGVLFLRAPLINQIGYIDPWFDDGYAWSLAHGLNLFADPYYGVRFPPILLIAGAEDIFGALGGYLVLHYLILVLAGAALYHCARQVASWRVAAASVVLLSLEVYYLRLSLWDYASFVQIPAMLAAVALWPRLSGRWRLVAAAGAGACVSLAAFSNPISLLFVPPLLLVEVVAAGRRHDGELVRIAARLAAAAVGAVVIFLLGWFVYWLVDGFSPHDMIAPTLFYIRNGNGAAFVEPIRTWIFNEPKIYAPVVMMAGLILIARRRLLGTDVIARLGQFSILFVAELWLYRLVDTKSAIVESWWAYDITAISMAFAGVVILDELDRLPRRRVFAIVGAVLAAAVADLVIRALGVHADNAYGNLRGHYWRELVVVILGLGALFFWPRLSAALKVLAVMALVVVVTGLSLTPAVYLGVGRTGEFSYTPLDELRTYEIGPTIVRDVAAQDTPASRTLIWFPQQNDLLSSTWATLPSLGGTMSDYLLATSLAKLNPIERDRLAFPTTSRLLVVGQSPGSLERARATLHRAGYPFAAGPAGTWVGGRVQHQLLTLRNLPAGDADQAVRLMVGAIRHAWRAGNASHLCLWTYPSLLGAVQAQGGGNCEAGMQKVLRAHSAPPGAIRAIADVPNGDISVTIAGVSTPWLFSRAVGDWLLVAGVPWIP
jgi:hypothetical protein